MTTTIRPRRRTYLQQEMAWQDTHLATTAAALADPHCTETTRQWAQTFSADCQDYRDKLQAELDELDALTT